MPLIENRTTYPYQLVLVTCSLRVTELQQTNMKFLDWGSGTPEKLAQLYTSFIFVLKLKPFCTLNLIKFSPKLAS